MFGNKSQRQIEASKEGLWIMQERAQLQQMCEQEYGKCVTCEDNDITDSHRCRLCINGGGTLKMFREKKRRRRRHNV